MDKIREKKYIEIEKHFKYIEDKINEYRFCVGYNSIDDDYETNIDFIKIEDKIYFLDIEDNKIIFSSDEKFYNFVEFENYYVSPSPELEIFLSNDSFIFEDFRDRKYYFSDNIIYPFDIENQVSEIYDQIFTDGVITKLDRELNEEEIKILEDEYNYSFYPSK